MSFSTYASGLNRALGITFDNSNNLYIANESGNNIVKVDILGNQSIFATGFNYTENVVFDNTGFPNGYLYVMDSTNTIYKVNVNGNITTFIINLNDHYIGMVFDANNNLYYSSVNNNIYKIDTNGNTTTFIDGSSVLSYPLGLTFDNNGNLLIANTNNQYISKYNSTGNIINGQFISIPNNIWINVIVDKSNNIYACYTNDSNYNGEYLNKYDSNGNLIYTIYNDPTKSILGITLDNIGNLYFTSDNNTTIIKYTIPSSTNYYVDNSGTVVDLNTIFAPYSGGLDASATGFKVNNYGGVSGQTDLSVLFQAYTSGFTAPPTGYVVENYGDVSGNNQDLANIFEYVYSFPFTFNTGSSSNYNVSSLPGGYYMIQFKIGSFSFQPATTIQLYDLFLVAGGADGTTSGGKGGEVIDISFNSTPLTVNSTYSFSLTVGSGRQDSSSNVIHNGIPYTPLTASAIGGDGASGGVFGAGNGSSGTTNIYTGFYYGGGGGGGGTVYQGGGIGGLGGGGGGGAGSAGPGAYSTGGNGGGITNIITGGSGGYGNNGSSSLYGGGGGGCIGYQTSQFNGGNGDNNNGNSGGGIGGSGTNNADYGGGGGGGGYYGGGGGGSGNGNASSGGGGAGVILLIYK